MHYFFCYFSGSLITKDLSDIVKAEDFVRSSEYLQTVVVVVPRILTKEWEAKYATFASMVVPGSAKRIAEDQEHSLYTVTLFQKVLDEYKTNCREHKYVSPAIFSVFITFCAVVSH